MLNKYEWIERPVLITGLPGSGTSLLMDLIDGHPDILVYPEEPYFRDVFRRRYKSKDHLLIDWKIGTSNPMHKPCDWLKESMKSHNPNLFEPITVNTRLRENILSLNDMNGCLRGKDTSVFNEKKIFDFEIYFNTMNKLLKERFFSLKDLMKATIY